MIFRAIIFIFSENFLKRSELPRGNEADQQQKWSTSCQNRNWPAVNFLIKLKYFLYYFLQIFFPILLFYNLFYPTSFHLYYHAYPRNYFTIYIDLLLVSQQLPHLKIFFRFFLSPKSTSIRQYFAKKQKQFQ